MLKFICTEEEFKAVLPAHQTLYEEDGSGRWVLKVEGAVPKKQLDDFRATNIELRRKVEAFGDITAEEAIELKAKRSEFEAGNDPKKIEALVEARTADMKKTYEAEKAVLVGERDTLNGRLAEHVIDGELLAAGTKAGLRSSAADDLIARGRRIFKVGADGKLEAIGADGNPVYGPSGEKLTPADWIGKLSKEAVHLFEPSTGAGTQGAGGRGTGGGKNPWAKDSWNLTEQGAAIRENKDGARQLAAAAGVTLDL